MIYYHKMEAPTSSGGDRDGSKDHPWYWYEKTSGYTISLNNEGTSQDDNCRLYIRVKLEAGTTYYIGETSPGGGDGKIWLFDENGQTLIYDDDTDEEIAGVYCNDHFEYTPETTGVYIIGAGAYSSSQGSYTLAISELPLADTPPSSQLIYSTSGGFNKFGLPIKYRSAVLAGCQAHLIPTRGLVFYAPLSASQQGLEEHGTVNYSSYKNIPCAIFNGSSYISFDASNLPTGNSDRTISLWMYITSTSSIQMAFSYGDPTGLEDLEIFCKRSEGIFVGTDSTDMIGTNITPYQQWKHIVFLTNSGTTYLYINGELVGTSSVAMETTAANGRIGSRGSSYLISGGVSSVRVYNRALTQAQVSILANQFHPTAS